MEVSQSGYYKWFSKKITYKEKQDIYLTNLIKQIRIKVKGRYGSLRILDSLRGLGEKVSRKRVNKLMKQNNIYSKVKRK